MRQQRLASDAGDAEVLGHFAHRLRPEQFVQVLAGEGYWRIVNSVHPTAPIARYVGTKLLS
jgi:hypothetical protein